jgi:hypothetical protein
MTGSKASAVAYAFSAANMPITQPRELLCAF